ncbi:unnamed protein product, partial [marine sediment metagenome]
MISSPRGPTSPITIALSAAARFAIFTPSVITFFNLLDGATGTNLLDKGLAPGESPSILNVKNPQAVYDIHRAYVDAGSDVILTNTFTANPINISSSKLKKVITE